MLVSKDKDWNDRTAPLTITHHTTSLLFLKWQVHKHAGLPLLCADHHAHYIEGIAMFYRSAVFVSMGCLSSMLYAQSQIPAQAPPSQTEVQVKTDTGGSQKNAFDATNQEDWNTIELAKSGLSENAATDMVINQVELDDCTRELVRLQWRPNDPIDLYVLRPKGTATPPVMLFLLNYSFDTDVFRNPAWCKEAKQNGMAAVGFASALSMQRFHAPRPMKQWFVSELQEALSTSTHDVQMILNYLGRRSDLDMKHIGMLGQGSGGAIAILAAAADQRITALDLIDPWGDWPDWLRASKQIHEQERADYLQAEFLAKVAQLDPVTVLPQLKLKALRIQQVTSDLVTPPAARDKIAAAIPSNGTVTHYPDNLAERNAWGTRGIGGWLTEHLQPKILVSDQEHLQQNSKTDNGRVNH